MITAIKNMMTGMECWSDRLGLLRWTSPILDKELRTTSRRKRYYLLRMGYVAVLAILLVQVWFFSMVMSLSGVSSMAFQASRMSEVALETTLAIQWFEFICLQTLSLVMLSGSISDELRKNTLEALLSSPIGSTQIVFGKLWARMWQLVLLAGISVPILAMLRVMGGVPLDFVLAGTCITVTAAMTAGLISLYCSISRRPGYQVIFRAVLICVLFYVIIPLGLYFLKFATITVPSWVESAALLLNPFVAFGAVSRSLMGAGASSTSLYPWPIHCLAMLVFCLLLAVLASRKVRAVAIAEPTRLKVRFRKLFTRKPIMDSEIPAADTVWVTFPEQRNPIACKELRKAGWWGFGTRQDQYVLAGVLCLLYGALWYFGGLREKAVHAIIVELLVLYGIFQIGSCSARAIVAEKEGRTWISVLTTPLDERRILWGKAESVLRRTFPVWLWLTLHIIVFVLIGPISPFALAAVPFLVIPMITVLMGLGFYLSSRLKSSTAAVAMTFVIPLALSMVCPCMISFSPLFSLPIVLFVNVEEIISMIYSTSEGSLFFIGTYLVQILFTFGTGWFLLKQTQKRIRLFNFENV